MRQPHSTRNSAARLGQKESIITCYKSSSVPEGPAVHITLSPQTQVVVLVHCMLLFFGILYESSISQFQLHNQSLQNFSLMRSLQQLCALWFVWYILLSRCMPKNVKHVMLRISGCEFQEYFLRTNFLSLLLLKPKIPDSTQVLNFSAFSPTNKNPNFPQPFLQQLYIILVWLSLLFVQSKNYLHLKRFESKVIFCLFQHLFHCSSSRSTLTFYLDK